MNRKPTKAETRNTLRQAIRQKQIQIALDYAESTERRINGRLVTGIIREQCAKLAEMYIAYHKATLGEPQ